MADRHTYATTDDLRDYLSGTNYSSGWTSDGSTIRTILETSSGLIDTYCGGGMFGPKTQTRYYDIGSGSLIDSPQYRRPSYGGNLGSVANMVSVIPLDGWLISATTVTSYKQTARTESETLTEGYGNDFLLMPYNFNPKTILKLNEDTAKGFYSGQQTLSILGSWGYQDQKSSGTTTGSITTTTETSWGVNDASGLSAGQTILVGSEQMYITGISSNTLTVERAVNGTTAATASAGTAVYSYVYPSEVVQACKDIARIMFRNRDLGVVSNIGAEGEAITTASNEIDDALGRLEGYRVASTSNGVIF